ncbi:amidohydrolase/deacetylase family metallohydrolase [Paenibacillus sp. Marseille-Q4541]|uniref:amidohydrolase/deacetylase family metallohydrolase n=1 Tax=Paenibacillus sp. Marseille-Q4541 TaxID=2831522 RepID=UPI0020197D73|nr:amidohydrolase/deacetylase family metallohydrolase [Paenibacillus sp. Marseille-Q4541]
MATTILRSVRTADHEERFDLIIVNGIIAGKSAPGTASGNNIIDCSSLYVSSGWIDMHVHAMESYQPYGDNMDEIGVRQGVTTIIDAGSCGADHIASLAQQSKEAATRVLAFLNISRIGLGERQDELCAEEWVDENEITTSINRFGSFIVGLKARISKSVVKNEGIRPLQTARYLSDKTGLPLMVHIGSGPPAIEEVLNLLQRKDIITHYLNGKKNNVLDENEQPLPEFLAAIKRGVHLDVGHGTASFSFEVAETARKLGIHPGTISSDIYRGNRLTGPVYSLAQVMSKFLLLGYSLVDVVNAVTTHAADWLGRPELGRIQVGDEANLTLFELVQDSIELTDSMGDLRKAETIIKTRGAIMGDKFYS